MDFPKLAARLAEQIARHPWRILAVALALSLLAGWAAAQLPVHTSRQALLPQDTAVAQRFNHFLQDFGAASDLMVVLEGVPRGELQAFANELAAKLAAEPEIAQATARLDMGFFLNHAYLLMPAERLPQLQTVLAQPSAKGGLEEMMRLAVAWTANPPSLAGFDTDLKSAQQGLRLAGAVMQEWRRWLDAEQPPAGLDWNALLAGQGAGGMADGYFASRDGGMLFVFVHPKNPSEDFQSLGPFVDKVKAVAADVAAQAKAQGRTPPTVGLTGLPAIEYEEYVNIRKDITLVVFTSAGLIAALILVVVRSLRWAALIFIPMGLGVLWSLGLALVTVGHLTIITAAFIAILFGLGADYGIFTSSRIAEERRAGKPLVEAIGAGIGSSFIAVATAGGASLLIFSVLATVDFPGFAELGVVAAKGVLMILISTWLVQPALYVLLPPKLADAAPVAVAEPGRGGRFPTPVALVVVALAVALAAFGAMRGLAIPFNYDVLAMLPESSQAAHYQKRMVAESDFQAEVVIFTAKDVAEARRITEEAGRFKSIAQVQSMANLFPDDAAQRVQTARAIGAAAASGQHAKLLAEARRAGLSEKSYALLQTALGNTLAILDDAQEQAFSAGHAELVKELERLRDSVESLRQQLAANPAQGRARSEHFLRALLGGAESGLATLSDWRDAQALTPAQLPPALRDRFFAKDGSMAVYAFPAQSVYDPDNLDRLMRDVYSVSPNATGFPTTHQAFAKSVVQSFSQGTVLALAVCLVWILLALRSLRGFVLAALPLLIGGGWMLGLMAWGGIQYNYANIVALPMVIALAVDYGVWFSYRWRELRGYSPFQVSLTAGKVICLAAGTELAGLGAITLAVTGACPAWA
ncbi:MAG: sterol transporter cytoplasmic membrane protein BstA [Candidatus Methylumidiphilus sp.]